MKKGGKHKMFGSQFCPVCKLEHDMPPFKQVNNGHFFRCDNCGKFIICPPADDYLTDKFTKKISDDRRKELSKHIQSCNKQNDIPIITIDLIDSFED